MKKIFMPILLVVGTTAGLMALVSYANPAGQRGGFGGFGGGPGGGPGGPPNQPDIELLAEFDKDENGWLSNEERAAAKPAAKEKASAGGGRGRGGPGGGRGPGGRGPGGRGPGGPGGAAVEPKPGKQIAESDVESFPGNELYDTSVVRTLFLEIDAENWEEELETFHGTDVDVLANLRVDGQDYPGVGLRFRGMSSYSHVSRGSKRSLNVSLDMVDEDQRLYGYKTLNLLNSHGDPSMMSSVVYSMIAREYLPAPKANFVRVVINGEDWGLYNNVQQFDKIFLKENFAGSKGTRWKVKGNPSADGGLRYLGDELEPYKERFDMKSNDGKKAWDKLVLLCKTLNETPTEELEAAIAPMLDIDGVLKFLALDVSLANSDGYWTRASDYSIFLDADDKFHIMPHDMNEAFALSGPGGGGPGGRGRGRGPQEGGTRGRPGEAVPEGAQRGGRPGEEQRPQGGRPEGAPPEGRPADDGRGQRGGRGFGDFFFGPPDGGPGGGFGGPGGGPGGRGPGGPGGPGGHGSTDLDPLIGLENERMPLRSRLLAVPSLKEKYLGYVRQIAEDSLDWSKLGPTLGQFRDSVSPIVMEDSRKLSTDEAFDSSTAVDKLPETGMSYRKFAQERSKFLLESLEK